MLRHRQTSVARLAALLSRVELGGGQPGVLHAVLGSVSGAQQQPARPFHASPPAQRNEPFDPTSYIQRKAPPANTVLRIVPQQMAYVVERFGKYSRTLTPGLHVLIPLVRREGQARVPLLRLGSRASG